MKKELNEVVVIDGVRTAFGKAGEKGVFWKTRADDLAVALLKALIQRNSKLRPDMIEDSIWGATNQVKEQGGTIGRAVLCWPTGDGTCRVVHRSHVRQRTHGNRLLWATSPQEWPTVC
jgi:acetyl-CoA acetyltransferase